MTPHVTATIPQARPLQYARPAEREYAVCESRKREQRAMIIKREYQPHAAALEELVEVLYTLLLEAPEGSEEAVETPCFPGRAE